MTQDVPNWPTAYDDDTRYLLSRAEWHESRAQAAVDPSTQKLHRRFAELYHRRAQS